MALARSAVARAPDDPSAQTLLARALAGAGELDEAESFLRQACARFPGHEPLHEALATVHARLGDVEAALACARGRAADWAPVFAFKLLIRHGRRDEAAPFEAAVAAARPADSDLLNMRARRVRDDPKALLRLSDEVLRHDPGAAHAIYYKSVALSQLGRGREAAELMAIKSFVQRIHIPPPPGLGPEPAFGEALRSEIVGNPTLHPDPAGHASSGGLRTRLFPAPGDRASVALIRQIRDSVGAYAEALSGDHPFVRARPSRATFTPWALLFGPGGRQVLHHHPGRWLTGVYYVGGADRGPSGALRIGVLPEWAGVEPPWPVLEIDPEPGTLLLFPSFVPHETVPPADGERISVAFDVAADALPG